jgi:hypothetical protein
MEHINDEFRMTNGGMNVAEMVWVTVADHMLRLIPLGAGHSRAPVEAVVRAALASAFHGF